MAGSYPDVPSWRMSWDLDGTQMYSANSGFASSALLSDAQKQSLNSEAVGAGVASAGFIVFFSDKRDVDAMWINASGAVSNLAVSDDTTNGVDGTWASSGAFTSTNDAGVPLGSGWRTAIQSETFLGIHAIRWNQAGTLRNLHLYGEPSPGENLKRLEIWHPTLDQRLGQAALDWGDVPRGGTADKTFRVKNMHPSLSARGVVLSLGALTDTTPSVVGQHVLSSDGLMWTATAAVGDLAPGTISPVQRIRRITPSNAVLTPPRWALRLIPTATSWS